jgi:hypothetical protein
MADDSGYSASTRSPLRSKLILSSLDLDLSGFENFSILHMSTMSNVENFSTLRLLIVKIFQH